MDDKTAQAFAKLGKGQEAQIVWRFLEDYLINRQQKLDKELFDAPPERWHALVQQKIEAHLFILALHQAMKAGASAGRTLQPFMEHTNA